MFRQDNIRQADGYGEGYFHASRGTRLHNGVDFICKVGDKIPSTVCGGVTKLGYPYGDDLFFRYVEVTSLSGNKHRFFYVKPTVNIGDEVHIGTMLGTSQTLQDRYPNNMTQHVHYEIIVPKEGKKTFIDPEVFLG